MTTGGGGEKKTIVFFGDYKPELIRVRNFAQGFGEAGFGVRHCFTEKRNLGKKGVLKNILFGAAGLMGQLISGRLYRERIFLVPEARLQFFPILYLLKLATGCKIVLDVYDFMLHKVDSRVKFRFFNAPMASLLSGFERFCFRKSDLLLVESDGCGDVIGKDLSVRTPVLVWPVWSYRKAGAEAAGVKMDAEKFNVLYWGNFHFHHGISTVLGAAAIIARKDRGVIFYFVGSDRVGKVRRYMDEASGLGLANVVFCGRQSEEALNSMIEKSGACLGIFSSHQKAMISITNKVFESLSMGKATITARSPVMESYFNDGVNIVLVEPDSPEDLADKILMLKNDRAMKERVAKNAYEFFWQDFQPGKKAREAARILGLA